MKSAVIYTTITNGYDALKQPLTSQNLPMVCLANQPQEQAGWEIRNTKILNNDPIRTARYHKLHPHLLFPEYEWSIWVDGSLLITSDLSALLTEVKNHGVLGVYRHAKRDCLYQAAENCIDKHKDDPQIIRQQMQTYQAAGFPQHQGLVASGVLVRQHHHPAVKQLMHAWWHEIKHHSRRDQLSFNYVCWQQAFSYYEIPERIGDGRFFRRNPHRAD